MSYSLTISIFRGIKYYLIKYGSILPVLLCLGVVSHMSHIFISLSASIFSWVIISNILDSILEEQKYSFEYDLRNAKISKQIEDTRIKILSKYEKLLEAKDYKQLISELKTIK